MSATIRDVAERAGVSLATVSKYLNGVRVREKNAQAIQNAILELDFRPNEIARGLRMNRTMTVGVLLPELDNLFFTEIISSVEQVLERFGYSTFVCVCHSDPEREQRRLDFLRRKQIDGVIAVPVSLASNFVTALEGLPTVLIDRIVSSAVIRGGRCTSVLSDNFAASYGAAEELLSAGHRKIGLLLGPDSNYTPIERRAGFFAACTTRDCRIPDEYIRSGEYSVESGYAMTRQLLELPDPPTALFATNNELTIGAMKALSEAGKIPGKDLSFIGFDSRFLAEVTHPRLSVILQPVEEIGRVAAETLLRMIDGEEGGRVVHLPTEFLRGDSVLTMEENIL